MENLTKICTNKKCQHKGSPQPASSFYKQQETRDGLHSWCKDCLKALSRKRNKQPKLPRGVSGTASENEAIEYLASYGIVATPGKHTKMSLSDIAAWDCVGIEVKKGSLEAKSKVEEYHFGFTPNQRKRGILAHVVLLIVPRDIETTYHIIPANHPAMYRDGRLKTAFAYRPGQFEQKKFSAHFTTFTEKDAIASRDAVHLIEDIRLEISRKLMQGVPIASLMPRVNQLTQPLVLPIAA